jgi:hypothetical protein
MEKQKRPIIFIYPLNETLRQLKELVTEMSESENLEVYEVDQQNEIIQLVPTLGPCLMISAQPKKCAGILKALHKHLKKTSSKTLLLNKKRLKPDTLVKLQKIGLTELIVEPINPKTLVYKVKLLLRSLPLQREKQEYEQKKVGESKNKEEIEEEKKLREKEEKGQEATESILRERRQVENIDTEKTQELDRDNFEEEEHETADINIKKKAQVYEGHYDGEVDEDKDEEELDGHYRGKVKKNNLNLESDEEAISDEENEEENFDDSHVQASNGLDIEAVEEEGEDLGKVAEFDKYYRGKKKKGHDSEEVEESDSDLFPDEEDLLEDNKDLKDFRLEIDIENDQEDKEENEDSDDGIEHSQDISLSIDHVEEVDNSDFIDEDESENNNKDKKNKTFSIEEGSKELSIEKEEESEEENLGPQKSKRLELDIEKAPEDFIDKDEPNEEMPADSKEKSTRLEIIASEEKTTKEPKDDEESIKKESLKKSELSDIEKTDPEKNKEEQADENLSEDILKKSSFLSIDKVKDEKDKEEQGEDELSSKNDFSSHSSLEIEKAKKDKSLENQENDESHSHKRRSSHGFQEEDYSPKAHDSRREHIQKYYGQKKRKEDAPIDWDINLDKKNKAFDPFKNHKEGDTLLYSKKDLGEQTIDYAKLKEIFQSSISYSKAGKRNIGLIKGDRDEPSSRTLEQEKREEDETSAAPTLYPADTGGAEHIIALYELSLDKNKKPQDIFHYMGKVAWNHFSAMIAISLQHPGDKDFKSLYQSSLDQKLQIPSDILQEKQERFKAFTIPDSKFPSWINREETLFYYPFFEGITFYGYIIFITEKKCQPEALLEASRGLMLDLFHQKGKGEVLNLVKEQKKEAVKQSLPPLLNKFLSFFKKAG